VSSTDRINTLWDLVRASSAAGKRARRRLVAGASLATLMSGLLSAIGLGIVVVACAACVLLTIGGAALVRALSVHWPSLRLLGARSAAAVVRGSGILIADGRTGLTRLLRLTRSALMCLRLQSRHYARISADRAARVRRHVATFGAAALTRMREETAQRKRQRSSPRTQPIDLHRQALRLNASGTQRRRSGAYAEAVDLHRRALEILNGLDDPRDLALTKNNLALALSHLGEDGNAIALFEEAAATLRALGDDEHEGRIMANLGLAHRRHGRHEQSENVLQLALTKLPPASSAYETVEAELGKAS
jgi:Tetratricopeptide repeat